jgi:hypothetical protein
MPSWKVSRRWIVEHLAATTDDRRLTTNDGLRHNAKTQRRKDAKGFFLKGRDALCGRGLLEEGDGGEEGSKGEVPRPCYVK